MTNRVLVVGPKVADFDPGFTRGIARAFEALGFQTKIVTFAEPSPPDFLSRLLIDGLGLFGIRKYYDRFVHKFNGHLLNIYNQYCPDIVFVLKGSKIQAETISAMKSSTNVLWCYDLARRSGISAQKAQNYSKVYCFEKSDVAWVKQHFQVDAGYLPMGYDPQVFYPLESCEKDIDVFFVGAYYPERRAFLEKMVEALPAVKFAFYGRHIRYREPKTWLKALQYRLRGKASTFVNHCLNADQVNQMYNRSKICLNIHHAQSKDSCNPRAFEISGTRSVQLADDIPYFSSNNIDCILTYSSFEHAVRLIPELLESYETRENISQQAYNWAVKQHSFQNRLRDVLNDIQTATD